MNIRLSIIVITLLMGCQSAKNMGSLDEKETEGNTAQNIEHDLSMYPKPSAELTRHIIILPAKEEESDFKIELYAGKTMEVDCNKHTLAGELEEKTVSGWGYSYLEFTTNGNIISTRMACPEASLHEEFVHAGSKLVRYNSKLPIVVYTPTGYEVRYKIWNRDTKEYVAKSI
ncbi:MAG: serine protease inhibitor ecotin [Flavobacteriaceae bacterium]